MASSCFVVSPAQTSSIEISSMNPLQPPQKDVRSPANAETLKVHVAVAEADLPALGRELIDARVELIHRAAGDRAVVHVDSSVARVESPRIAPANEQSARRTDPAGPKL